MSGQASDEGAAIGGRRRVEPGEELALGAHLLSPRRGYIHHGIYVGGGRVIHYGAGFGAVPRGPIEEVSLERFAHGRALWVRTDAPAYEPEEVVRRARSRLGENRYRLLSNNCEHFCEWCLRGRAVSYQVEIILERPRRTVRAAARVLGRFAPRPEGRVADARAQAA